VWLQVPDIMREYVVTGASSYEELQAAAAAVPKLQLTASLQQLQEAAAAAAAAALAAPEKLGQQQQQQHVQEGAVAAVAHGAGFAAACQLAALAPSTAPRAPLILAKAVAELWPMQRSLLAGWLHCFH